MDIPLVSAIIIEYLCLDELSGSIAGIKKNLSGYNFEIIISSNSGYDIGHQEYVKIRFPEAHWIFNEKNGGFAYGINKGLQIARGKYLVISNPDAVIIDGFLGMIGFMDEHPEVGAVGPQIVDNDGNIQDNCRNYVSAQAFFLRQVRRACRNIPVRERGLDTSLIQTVDWLAGAFIMVRREVYKETNGLDEKYFMYAEDMDWCLRIRKAGSEIVYYPGMHVKFCGSRRNRKLNVYTWIFIKSHMKFWNKFGYFSGYPKRKDAIYQNNELNANR
jgi:N-acetylglucosaminyl-diphospho-decaprenol L-rhamnosyltransferase